jgi:hypothetical protein
MPPAIREHDPVDHTTYDIGMVLLASKSQRNTRFDKLLIHSIVRADLRIGRAKRAARPARETWFDD